MSVARWLELRVRAPDTDPDLVVEALLEIGGRAVQEDGAWQVTHIEDPGAGGAIEALVAALRARIPDAPDVQVETRWQRQEDWEVFWRRGLEARRLTDRLVVTPSWIETDPGPGDLVIVLDPKMAFGNAEHGTTRGCLRLLDGLVRPGDRLLDVGAGSAILSIAGALFGAGRVEALEADPLAIPAAAENLERNGVADRVSLRQVRVTNDDLVALPHFDGVMANLEAGLLRPLLPGLAHATRPGGWLVLSGILDHEWEDVRAAVESLGLRLRAVDADGEWCSGLFRRPGGD
ncbi:MAG: 50S ribosomal protein L11 methyltransferase [Gemmatimonadales bacterium]|jgi:ribosomal protein L11 methyltransferase|nr:MAG: 50S ribosomal protein L11 methyltransferase [Gemmatimonadales bacterium]